MKFPLKVGDDPKPQHGSVQKDLPLKVDNVSKDWRSVSESIWLQFGGVDASNKMHILNRCLVGQWGDFTNDALLLSSLKEWARYHWRIKGNLSLSLLGGALILFSLKVQRRQRGCCRKERGFISRSSCFWIDGPQQQVVSKELKLSPLG